LIDDETARKFSEIGVTDMRVYNKKQLKLALKYGITPYCGTFTPRGKHRQVMAPAEEKHFAYINGLDLKNMKRADKKAEIDRRRIKMRHRYGGEPVAALDTLNSARIACFNSDENYELSKNIAGEKKSETFVSLSFVQFSIVEINVWMKDILSPPYLKRRCKGDRCYD
jgi:hypothetical protein